MAPVRVRFWSAAAEHGLGGTVGEDRDELARQVNAGVAELWQWGDTWFLTRVECPAGGRRELVVCCLKGRGVHAVAELLLAAARGQGIGRIRFHTRRPALGRMLRRYGVRELERVYGVDLPG